MTDIYITITDKDNRVLRRVTIWEDGSDREYSDEIADEILEDFDGAREVDAHGCIVTKEEV
jgi:hypothetical protein